MKYIVLLRTCLLVGVSLVLLENDSWGQNFTNSDLVLYGQDVRIEENVQAKGFYLYVRKKTAISSVLLTESAEATNRDENTYAFRSPIFNGVNGNERRVLNGRFIQAKTGFFIVDSSPEPDPVYGSAFVLFIPYIVEFGYSNTRNGVKDIQNEGFYMSVRTFTNPYADYTGNYVDNSFYLERTEEVENDITEDIPREGILTPPNLSPTFQPTDVVSVVQPAAVVPTDEQTPPVIVQEPNALSSLDKFLNVAVSDKYSADTVSSFTNIAKKTNSGAIFVENKNDIVDKISGVLEQLPQGKSKDVLILLDTTRSMWDDLAVLKSRLIPTVSRIMQGEIYRMGVVLYRDEGEEYLTKRIDFSDRLDTVQKLLNGVQAKGGGDWPEAVYEAFYIGVYDYTWVAENRVIFIVGDAPPHEPPNTRVNLDELYSTAASKKIAVYPLIIPKRD